MRCSAIWLFSVTIDSAPEMKSIAVLIFVFSYCLCHTYDINQLVSLSFISYLSSGTPKFAAPSNLSSNMQPNFFSFPVIGFYQFRIIFRSIKSQMKKKHKRPGNNFDFQSQSSTFYLTKPSESKMISYIAMKQKTKL